MAQEMEIATPRGVVLARAAAAPGADADRGVLMVGGVGGGWDTPAGGLYPRLLDELPASGIHALRVRFRNPRDLDEATADALAGAARLRAMGARRIGLVGHSFGGAVVARAAARAAEARAIVALAPQAYGAEGVATLGPRCAALFVHGRDDAVLPPSASMYLHQHAREPKRLVLLDGAGHVLDEVAEQVHDETLAWLRQHL